jgi:AraC-like DNA-binding protein
MWRFEREPGPDTEAYSTPGHLFHLMREGAYHLTTNGREYRVSAGDLVYYYGNEEVTCHWDGGRVEMLSLAVDAPGLAPLPLEERVRQASDEVQRHFLELYSLHRNPDGEGTRLELFASLHSLLARIGFQSTSTARSTSKGGWTEVESLLQREGRFRVSLDELSALAHRSRASLVRDCRAATGMSPQKRLQVLRMGEARGLLNFSPLRIREIAEHLGYPRQHEFTREFSRYFGHPPTAHRYGQF